MKRKLEEGTESNNTILWVGMAAGGVLVLVLLCGGVSIGGYLLWRRSPNPDPALTDAGGAKTDGLANKDGKAKRPDIRIVIPDAEAQLAMDPKWLVGPDLKKVLPGGRWKNSTGEGREFFADGTLTTYAGGVTGGMATMKGTYGLTGADTVEMTMQTPLAGLQKETFRVLVNDDEMALLKDEFGGSKLKPGEYWLVGKYYRMRPDGAGLARTKLIDPHIENLKSKEKRLQDSACFMLGTFGEDAWPCVPALIPMLEKSPAALNAVDLVRKIGPKAKAAVPSLRKHLASEDRRTLEFTMWALGEIGPDARDAIPDLRKFQGKFGIEEPAAKALKKIEGK